MMVFLSMCCITGDVMGGRKLGAGHFSMPFLTTEMSGIGTVHKCTRTE